MNKLKVEDIDKVFSQMSEPSHPWKPNTEKQIGDYLYSVENADGYRIEEVSLLDGTVIYTNMVDDSTTFDENFVEE